MNIIPIILDGNRSTDERGSVRFVNEFTFSDIKRFYQVENKDIHVIRAFHGHMKEAKYVYVTHGKILFCAVKLSSSKNPSTNVPVLKFILSSTCPQVLYIPPTFANGFRALSKNASVIFFSTATLEESLADDFRFDPFYWGKKIWD